MHNLSWKIIMNRFDITYLNLLKGERNENYLFFLQSGRDQEPDREG
jgi:hypothetical protein